MRALSTLHSTSTSGSNRRVPPPRGSSSPAPLGHPLLPALALRLLSLTRRILTPRCAACGSTFPVGPLSLLLVLRLHHCARLCARCTSRGADGCVSPSAIAGVFWNRIRYLFAFDRLFRGVFSYRSTTSSPLLSSPTLLMITSSSRARMVSTDTFRGGSGNRSVRSLNVVMWMQEHWFVLSCIHVLNHKRSFQTLRVSTLHVQVLVLFCEARNKGRC